MNPQDLQLLVTRTMPFGKYKGRIVADLPGDYLRWFVREGGAKGETGPPACFALTFRDLPAAVSVLRPASSARG